MPCAATPHEPGGAAPLPYLPIFLDVAGRRAVVVGAGPAAEAKAALLARAGARVRVVGADTVRRGGPMEHRTQPFEPGDLDGAALAIVASDDEALADRVVAAARARGVPVNVVDRPACCDFIMPAILERAPVVVAVSTGGVAPALARLIRQRLELAIPAGFGRLAAFAGRLRAAVRARLATPAERQRYWDAVLDGGIAELVLAGREPDARQAAYDALAAAARGQTAPGMVWLVGAGPGNPDLLTVAAVRLLGKADVILYDELVGPGILDLARREAQLIPVGKRAGSHALPQSEINALMVRLARAGRHVVRLKGGDPMLFGRAGEEIAHLRAHGIAVQVVPGITAALGCAAAAGVSLTRRGQVRQVHIATAQCRPGDEDAIDWQRLADPDGTLAIYMGCGRLGEISRRLIAAGLAPDTPALVIENGTLPDERRIALPLAELPTAAHRLGDGPALVLIGAAVAAGGSAEAASPALEAVA